MDRETAVPRVDSMPGEKVCKWVAYHHEHVVPSTYVYDFVWDIIMESEGPLCTDIDGNVLLDLTSYVAAAPFGYNNPKFTDRMAELDPVDPTKTAGQDLYASDSSTPGEGRLPGPAVLMDGLTDLTSHYGMDTAFLSNSRAEAVENAIKIVYDHADGAKYGVAFEGTFHSRTFGVLSLNRSKSVYRRKFPEISDVLDVPFCDNRTCSPRTCSCGFSPDADSAVSKLRQKFHSKKNHIDVDEVAYTIVKPIQGEGGCRFPSGALVEELATVVGDYDLTLIANEIQTGVGRTGELWGSDHYPLELDIITDAKGLRVDAIISNDGILPDGTSRLSSTWGAGDIVLSIQGVLTLEAIEEHDLLDNVVVRGRQSIGRTRDDAPDTVVDACGKGLLLAVEFDIKERRDAVQEAALKRSLPTLSCGYKALRILPPLDATTREIDLGATMLLGATEDVS